MKNTYFDQREKKPESEIRLSPTLVFPTMLLACPHALISTKTVPCSSLLSRSWLQTRLPRFHASTLPTQPTLLLRYDVFGKGPNHTDHYLAYLLTLFLLHIIHPEHLTPRRESACILVALRVNLHTATKSTSCSSCIMLSTDSNLP